MTNIFELVGRSPCTHISNLVSFNEYEFITAGENKYFRDAEGIYKFNTKTNNWSLFISYPSHLRISFHSICYNAKTNIIYMYCKENLMIKINTKTHQFDINHVLSPNIESYPSLFILDNKCHLIGGNKNRSHLIWDDDKKQFDTFFEFNEWKRGNRAPGIIHLRYNHSLILFGGSNTRNSNVFWKYDYGVKANKNGTHKDDKKWIKLSKDLSLPTMMHKFGWIIDANQQYLVLLGGPYNNTQNVFILNLRNYKWYKTQNIECPLKGHCYAILDGDPANELKSLVYGFITNISKECDLNIPNELIAICQRYCSTETVHIISENTKNHHRVNLTHIIDAMVLLE